MSKYLYDDLTVSVSSQLTANNNGFYFDYQNGEYGFNTSANRGADTFSPFKRTETNYKAIFVCSYANPGNTCPGYTILFVSKDYPNMNRNKTHGNMMLSTDAAVGIDCALLYFYKAANSHTGTITFRQKCERWNLDNFSSSPITVNAGASYTYTELYGNNMIVVW